MRIDHTKLRYKIPIKYSFITRARRQQEKKVVHNPEIYKLMDSSAKKFEKLVNFIFTFSTLLLHVFFALL